MLVILMITKRSYIIIMNELKLLEETKENVSETNSIKSQETEGKGKD